MTTAQQQPEPTETVIFVSSHDAGTSTVINSQLGQVHFVKPPKENHGQFLGLGSVVVDGVEYVEASAVTGNLLRSQVALAVSNRMRLPHGAKLIFVIAVDKSTGKLQASHVDTVGVVLSAFHDARVQFGVVVNKIPAGVSHVKLYQEVMDTIKTETCSPIPHVIMCPLVPDLEEATDQLSKTAFAEVACLMKETPTTHLEPLDDIADDVVIDPATSSLPRIVMAIGNPGSGKSTLINGAAQSIVTQAGSSAGHGIQHDKLLKFEINGTTWIDTPGLSDVKYRTRAAGQITDALKDQEGLYRLIFVVTTESGRVKPDDLATLTIVLNAIRKKNVPYGVIINKISERLLQKMLTEAEFYDKLICSLNSGPYSTNHIFLAPEDQDARDADNCIIPASAMTPVLNFIETVPCIAIRPTDVEAIKTSDFDDQEAKLKDLVEMMITAHSKQLEQIVIMHESAMAQHRETLRMLQADQARRDEMTNGMLESLRTQAAEESQRRDKIQERLEEIMAKANRGQLEARQAHMKTMLEMEKARSEARERELKMKLEAERKRLEMEKAHQKEMHDTKAAHDKETNRLENMIKDVEKEVNRPRDSCIVM
ncbi:hypothetical protein AMAG_12856 [Allomyces macrogynus ATCC 38327]|uniref:G domain-containing protein n=1 Tax=Allomyces macrogynus (strain ATCC 38327) TaxID=578462 RepID=A0A0L0T1Q2_ALLM3|nr:hypothetical protein AMAG_12856 [Allomyces macrogynus ATCC 38327]|eukprot:KNE68686.1 hypothetical protein AMAG_12856 [Allomyces macrogynus ATCC 38327]